jgi:hypothetical protein
VQQFDGVTTHLHDGSGGTFYATVMIQPDRRFALAVIGNAVPPRVGESMQAAAAALARLR